MFCQLCLKYHGAERVEEKVSIGGGKQTIIINRVCPVKESIVNEGDDSCEAFEPTNIFWCGDRDQWVYLKVCQARQRKEICYCTVGGQVASIQIKTKKQLVIRKKKKQLVIRKKLL